MKTKPQYKIVNNNIYDDWCSDRTWSVVSIRPHKRVVKIRPYKEICKCDTKDIAQFVCDALNNYKEKDN